MSRVTEWTVTLPVWAMALIAFAALVVLAFAVAFAMTAGQADRTAESYDRQRAIRDQALREHEHRTRNRH